MGIKAQPRVYFFSDGIKISLKNRNVLKEFICLIFKEEKVKLESITYIFTTDKAVLKINREYLKHDFLTDVITFGLTGPGQPVIADVYISIERVRDNSKHLSLQFNEELLRVVFHGALHLCGYSDKSISQKKEMRNKENFYLSNYMGKRFT